MTRAFDRMRSGAADTVAGLPPTGDVDSLRGRKHVLLVSYRRDGRPVPSPMWFGCDEDGTVYCRSGAGDAKVARVRRNPNVLIAPCDRRGAPVGPPLQGLARVVERAEEGAAEQVIRANFGLGRRIYKRVLGDAVPAAYIRVTAAPW